MADEDKAAPVMRQDASTGEMVEDKQATAEKAAAVDSKKPTIHIKVYAPFKVYYEGDAYSLSAVNETGPFDILPHHHNFLCMLVPCELVIRTPYETKRVKVARALMHVNAEKVTVFVDV
jgi:F0F1-type ATP synthase epsilon subunit